MRKRRRLRFPPLRGGNKSGVCEHAGVEGHPTRTLP